MSVIALPEKAQAHYEQQIALLAANTNLSVGWQQHSQQAWQNFLQLGFPTRRQESWRYLDLTAFLKQAFSLTPLASELSVSPSLDAQHFLVASYTIYCYNGQFLLDKTSKLPKGVAISSAINNSVTVYESLLAKNPLDQLNQASAIEGIDLKIADNAIIDKPIHIVYLSNETAAGKMLSLRSQWHIGKNSQASIMESFIGSGEVHYCQNISTSIQLATGARLIHYMLQQEGSLAFHFNQQVISQQQDSVYHGHTYSLGGSLLRNEKTVLLEGSGAHCELSGVYHSALREQVANHIRLQHEAAHTTSKTNYKGLADGQSKAIFNGSIYVKENAQKINAQLSNKNLLLSANAAVNTKPELEIYADDVQCAHGANVGQLDENALFFLQARGMAPTQARQMLIRAFAVDRLASITDPAIRQLIEAQIDARI